jgi:hypothetical protein
MKKTLAKLLCGVLMLAMPMALFAKKSKNDSIYRPLYTAFEINIGGAAWKEKPLSYFTFNGTNLSLSLEMMRACRGESKWVQQHQLRYIYNSGDMAISGNGGSKVHLFNYTYGVMCHSKVAPKFRLYYGPDINVMAGAISNIHGGNNPKTFKGDLSIGFTGMAVWDFKLGKLPVTSRYQMSLPVFSAFIQQKQGYMAHSFADGWTFGSFGKHFNMRNRLHFDLHFSSWALRLGYNNDILTNYATSNHFQYVSHNFVLGFAGELMRWNPKNANKKIKTALYTY